MVDYGYEFAYQPGSSADTDSEDMPTDILPMVWLGMKQIITDNSCMRRDLEKLDKGTRINQPV